MSKIVVGLYNWHDAGYCVLKDGKLIEHIEVERYSRLKESPGDSLKYFRECFLEKEGLKMEDVDHWVSSFPHHNLESASGVTYDTHTYLPQEKIVYYPHHLCHAAHAYFSSGFEDSIILTLDSAGLDENNRAVSTCAYWAEGNKIEKIFDVSSEVMSLGSLWGRFTRFVFKMSSGYPRGHQAGSVMAMAALGDARKYLQEIFRAATTDYHAVKQVPPGCKRGVYVPPEEDVVHPYLNRFRAIAEQDEQEKFNIAAALQLTTETIIFDVVRGALAEIQKKGKTSKNICLAGGVALNSVAIGKIKEHFSDQIENCFIPPVPYDGGLSIGAAQYHWYSVLGNKREHKFVSPYLGEEYTLPDVRSALVHFQEQVTVTAGFTLDSCVDLLIDQKIVSIFNGRSESGRRALGNRSILADPRSPAMKDMINEKVKHRQWYRPFAPSILEDYGEEWFDGFFPSPYMSFVFKFKKEKLGLVPAVEHFDGSARLQSVSREQNEFYYDLIDKFREKTDTPIVLNTSFNDREPICETPTHAISCFLGTDIDYLYFPEYELLISKNENSNK